MAASCNKSLSAFQKWRVEPIAKISPNVFYTVADVLANRLENQAARLQKRDSAELVQAEREEKLRLTKLQADGQEIRNQQLRRELAPVAFMEWALGKAAGQISAIFDSIPARVKKHNPKLTASNIEMIRRDVLKAQNAVAYMAVDLDEYCERNETTST